MLLLQEVELFQAAVQICPDVVPAVGRIMLSLVNCYPSFALRKPTLSVSLHVSTKYLSSQCVSIKAALRT